MRFLSISLGLLLSLQLTTAWSRNANNQLISPDKIEQVGHPDKGVERLKITFSIPCDRADTVGFVFVADTHGEQQHYVGVTYSGVGRDCSPLETVKKHERIVDLKEYGLKWGDAYIPMDTTDKKVKKLRDYIVARIDKREGQKSLLELTAGKVLEKDNILILKDSFRCLAVRGEANQYKAVGTCLYQVIDKKTEGRNYKGTFSVTVSDDPENPDESRAWTVEQVTAFF